jgi:hypothetical protein
MKKSPISGEFWNYQFDGKIDKEVFIFEIIIFFRPQISASMEHLFRVKNSRWIEVLFEPEKQQTSNENMREVAINGNYCSTSF